MHEAKGLLEVALLLVQVPTAVIVLITRVQALKKREVPHRRHLKQ